MSQLKCSLVNFFLILAFVFHSSFALGGANFTRIYVDDESDLLAGGKIIEANNLGSGAQQVDVGCIPFGNDHSGLSALGHNWILSVANFCVECQGNLDLLLDTLVWQAGHPIPITLTISGLVPGNRHRIQLFFANDLNATAASTNVIIEGTRYRLSNWRPRSVNLVAEFTASSSTVVVTFPAASYTPYRAVLNAYSLHDLDQADSPCAGTCVDEDQDGFCQEDDCNDSDSSVHPNALDSLCNGVDNNCNGQIDEDFNSSTCLSASNNCGERNSGSHQCLGGQVLCDATAPADLPALLAYLDIDGDGVGEDEVDATCGLPPKAVLTGGDLCLNSSPDRMSLGPNQYGLLDFNSPFSIGKNNRLSKIYNAKSTHGCTCSQIVGKMSAGKGHLKKGCSPGLMEDFTGIDSSGDRGKR